MQIFVPLSNYGRQLYNNGQIITEYIFVFKTKYAKIKTIHIFVFDTIFLFAKKLQDCFMVSKLVKRYLIKMI